VRAAWIGTDMRWSILLASDDEIDEDFGRVFDFGLLSIENLLIKLLLDVESSMLLFLYDSS